MPMWGWGLAIGAVALVALAWGAWQWMMRAPYQPGQVHLRDDLTPPGQGLESPLDVGHGVHLHSFVRGEGPLTIVVHGGPGLPSSEPWPALQALEESRRFLYYHQRGAGRSTRLFDRPDEGGFMARMTQIVEAYGLAQHVADIERIRRRSGEDQVALVGHSFGAFLAALYAAEFPDAVSELVLLAPADVLKLPSDTEGLFGQVRASLSETDLEDYDAFIARYLDFSPAMFARTDDELVLLQDEFGAWYVKAAARAGWPLGEEGPTERSGGWMVWGIYTSMGRSHDYRAALHAIRAPTVVVHAGQDLQPVAVAEMYRDHIPGAQLQVLPDAGHMLHHTHPEALRDLLHRK